VKTIAAQVLLRALLEGSDDSWIAATMTCVVRHLHARSIDNVTVYGHLGMLSRAPRGVWLGSA